jgi:hypothetical protein
MRRFLVPSFLAVAVAVLAPAAAAKEMSVSLASGPPTLGPGEPWTAELLVHGEPDILNEARPGITLTSSGTGETKTFVARPTGKHAPDGQLIYRARVVIEEAGRWRWGLFDGVTDRLYEGGLVQVGKPAGEVRGGPASEPGVAPVASGDGGTPGWPFVLAGGVLVLLGAAAVLARRARPQPTG